MQTLSMVVLPAQFLSKKQQVTSSLIYTYKPFLIYQEGFINLLAVIMNNADRKKQDVKNMFGRISKRYDVLNRLMSFGFDIAWRRFLVKSVGLPEYGKVLDAGAGTGDIAFEILRQKPQLKVTCADLTFDMMTKGRDRNGGERADWCQADAENLPFYDSSFHAVVSGFLARNVPDILAMFREQVRVLKPGCRLVCLDTSPIPDNLLKPFIIVYYKYIIPLMGRLVAGEKNAYKYLPETTMGFLRPDSLAEVLKEAGLMNVEYKSFMFGNISVHWGIKPE